MSDTISIPLEYPVGRLELIDLPVRVAGSKTAAVLLGGSAGLAYACAPLGNAKLHVRPLDLYSSACRAISAPVSAVVIRIRASGAGELLGVADRQQRFDEPCDQQVLPEQTIQKNGGNFRPGKLGSFYAMDQGSGAIPRLPQMAAQLLGSAIRGGVSKTSVPVGHASAGTQDAEEKGAIGALAAQLLTQQGSSGAGGVGRSAVCPRDLAAELLGCPVTRRDDRSGRLGSTTSEATAAAAWAAARGVAETVRALRMGADGDGLDTADGSSEEGGTAVAKGGRYWLSRAQSGAPWQVLQGVLQPGFPPPAHLLPPTRLQDVPYGKQPPRSGSAIRRKAATRAEWSVGLSGLRLGGVPGADSAPAVPLLTAAEVQAVARHRLRHSEGLVEESIPPEHPPVDWQRWLDAGGRPYSYYLSSATSSSSAASSSPTGTGSVSAPQGDCPPGKWMAFRLLVALQRAMRLRPVWPYGALEALFPLVDGDRFAPLLDGMPSGRLPARDRVPGLLAQFLPGVAFLLNKDPFRNCWVRRGFDPRRDASSRVLQLVKANAEFKEHAGAIQAAKRRAHSSFGSRYADPARPGVSSSASSSSSSSPAFPARGPGASSYPAMGLTDGPGSPSAASPSHAAPIPPEYRAQFRFSLQPVSTGMCWAVVDQLLSGAGPEPIDATDLWRRRDEDEDGDDSDSDIRFATEAGKGKGKGKGKGEGSAHFAIAGYRSPTRVRARSSSVGSEADARAEGRKYLAQDGRPLAEGNMGGAPGSVSVPLEGLIAGLRVVSPASLGLDPRLLSQDREVLRVALPSLERGVRDSLADSAVRGHAGRFEVSASGSRDTVGWLPGDARDRLREAGRRAVEAMAAGVARGGGKGEGEGGAAGAPSGRAAGERFVIPFE